MKTERPEELPEEFADASWTEGMTLEEKERIYRRARHRAGARVGLYIHTAGFVLVMILLAVINLTTSPDSLWVVFPFVGWGLGLAVHWLAVSRLGEAFRRLEEREIARELERELDR